MRSMRPRVGGSLLVESVVRAIRHAQECSRRIAGRVGATAMRVQALDGCDSAEKSGPVPGSNIQSQKRNIVRGRAGRLRRNLGAHGAAVRHHPNRSCKMVADGLAVDYQRCYRLAELPGQFAVGICLSLVDLRPGRVHRRNQCFTTSSNRLGNFSRRRRRGDHPHGQIRGNDCKDDRTKNAASDSEEFRSGLRAEGQRFLAITLDIDPEAPDRVQFHHMLHSFSAAWMRPFRSKDFESGLICS